MSKVEIVVPVYNEQADLAESIRRLHSHLAEHFLFGSDAPVQTAAGY
jgi:glycosyltransferase involved in cell wall biosynthesis